MRYHRYSNYSGYPFGMVVGAMGAFCYVTTGDAGAWGPGFETVENVGFFDRFF